MTPETFLKEFCALTETPGGVGKLRQLVLELAIGGMLTRPELRGARAEGSSGDLPPGWRWSATYEIGVVSPRNKAPADMKSGFLPMTEVPVHFAAKPTPSSRPWKEVRKGYTHIADGDVVVAKITPCFQNRKSCVVEGLENGVGGGTTELHVVRPDVDLVNPRYLLAFFKTPKFILGGVAQMTGTAGQQRVPKEYFAQAQIPLPPLPEQKRIVAKVDHLLALCDELDARQTKRRKVSVRATKASLAALTEAQEPKDLQASWKRVSGHFDGLFDNVENVGELRQAILELAVRGKLVGQEPGDEPASALLLRIAGDASQRKPKRGPEQFDPEELPFEVPAKWEWVRADETANPMTVITYGILKPVWVDDGVPTVRVRDMQNGALVTDDIGQCSPERAIKFNKTALRAGDLLIAKDGATLGKTAFVPASLTGGNVTQHVLRFSVSSHLSRKYIRLVVDSPHGQRWMRGETKGVALPGVNVGDFRRMPIPLPPIAEQNRIVAKVEQLMALCDDLEAKLKLSGERGEKLMKAVVEAMVA